MADENRELLKSLTSLYLLLAAIDGEFNNLEELTIQEKIHEWDSDLDSNSIAQVFNESVHILRITDRSLEFDRCSNIIKEKFDLDNKINVLKDLIAIAISDGKFHDNEKTMINSLAEIWGLSEDIDIDEYVKEVAANTMLNMKDPDDILREMGLSDEDIESVKIQETDKEKEKSKKEEMVLPEEIIVEVDKVGDNYRAKVKNTEFDFTGIINNTAKLKYAFEGSGLIRGKKNKLGNYDWRVISKGLASDTIRRPKGTLEKKEKNKSNKSGNGNTDSEPILSHTQILFNIFMLRPYFRSINNTEEIENDFDNEVGELLNHERIDEFNIEEIYFAKSAGHLSSLIISAKLKAEAAYDKIDTHRNYLNKLDEYIIPLEQCSPILKQKYLEFLLILGSLLDSEHSPTQKLELQDRYLPLFIAIFRWEKTDEVIFSKALRALDSELGKGLFLRYTMKTKLLSIQEKTALVLYNQILLYENEELEIKTDDIYSSRGILAQCFKMGTVNVQDEASPIAKLLGGFENNFCYEVMQFYNAWLRIDLFRERCNEILNEIEDIIFQKSGVRLKEVMKQQLKADSYRTVPLL